MDKPSDQKPYILAIDQSTSATKVLLFDSNASLVHRINKSHQQYYPREGFVAHDAMEIFENTVKGLLEMLEFAGKDAEKIAAISITNQRETSLIWDITTGKPIAHAAVWQCQRGSSYCKELQDAGYGDMIREKTGLLIDPYFSASKLRSILLEVEGAEAKAKKGELLLGTMDSWLLWKLTNGKVHATDYSNACRTMLFNIHTLQWDEDLIRLFGLYPSMFPKVNFSDRIFGYTDTAIIPGRALPVAGVMGDSHAALFGQQCFEAGMAKATYGTGSSIMMNIGDRPLQAPEGLVTSIGWGRSGKIDYVFEGNIHCTGDTINWLVNDAELINTPQESEILAQSVPDNNQVYFVPSFVGLGAPYWDNEARAIICGMSRNTKKAHIVRAALEGIAFQVNDLVRLMVENSPMKLSEMRVDGGPTRNNFLMQFQSDILQVPIVRSDLEELSALGSACMAGLACGIWKHPDELKSLRKVNKVFYPICSREETEKMKQGWSLAVRKARLRTE